MYVDNGKTYQYYVSATTERRCDNGGVVHNYITNYTNDFVNAKVSYELHIHNSNVVNASMRHCGIMMDDEVVLFHYEIRWEWDFDKKEWIFRWKKQKT